MTRKQAITRFLICQGLVALVLYIGLTYLTSDFFYIVIFFIELYAFSKLEDALILLPESLQKYEYIFENGIEVNASVISISNTNKMTEFGEYYIFTLDLKTPPVVLVIETEVSFSLPNIDRLTTIPVRYLPDTMEAIILFDKLRGAVTIGSELHPEKTG